MLFVGNTEFNNKLNAIVFSIRICHGHGRSTGYFYEGFFFLTQDSRIGCKRYFVFFWLISGSRFFFFIASRCLRRRVGVAGLVFFAITFTGRENKNSRKKAKESNSFHNKI